MKPSIASLLVEIIASLLILLFVYTAISKLIDYRSFRLVLSKSPLIGNFSGLISILLPALELLTALLLLMPALRIWGLLASLCLMTLFTGYIIYMVSFEPHLPCSCGGVIKQLSWRGHLWFNTAFTLTALAGYLLARSDKLLFAISRRSRKPVEKSRQTLNI